jgi:hypothetical protein
VARVEGTTLDFTGVFAALLVFRMGLQTVFIRGFHPVVPVWQRAVLCPF